MGIFENLHSSEKRLEDLKEEREKTNKYNYDRK